MSSDFHEIRVREIATGIVRTAAIRPRSRGWTRCDHPDHDQALPAYLPRMWVEHPDGKVTKGSRGKPPRLFYCIPHAWQLYEEVVEEVTEIPTWDCETCDNDLNDGRPFAWTEDSQLAARRQCGLCALHGPKSEWPADLNRPLLGYLSHE